MLTILQLAFGFLQFDVILRLLLSMLIDGTDKCWAMEGVSCSNDDNFTPTKSLAGDKVTTIAMNDDNANNYTGPKHSLYTKSSCLNFTRTSHAH